MHSKFKSENLKGRNHLEDLDIDGKITFQWILEKQGRKLRTGFILFGIETSGGVL
jgi:hypothetical protein